MSGDSGRLSSGEWDPQLAEPGCLIETHSDSVAAFDSWAVELAITAGMMLAGTNFAIYYTAVQRGLGRAIGNAELLTYLGVLQAHRIRCW